MNSCWKCAVIPNIFRGFPTYVTWQWKDTYNLTNICWVRTQYACKPTTQIVLADLFIPNSKAKDSLQYLFSFSNPKVVINTESSWQISIRSSFHFNFIHSKLFTYLYILYSSVQKVIYIIKLLLVTPTIHKSWVKKEY